MARIFQDGFEHGNCIISAPGWEAQYGFGPARTGQRGLDVGGGAGYVALGGNYATLIVGCAFYRSGLFGNDAMITLLDGSSTQLVLLQRTDGGAELRRGGTSGTILGTIAAGTFQPSAWYYLEIKTTIHSSTGSYEIRINGASTLSGTSQNTQNSGNAYVTRIGFGAGGFKIDDLYINDTSGSLNNDFSGDIRIYALVPNTDGTYTDLTATGAAQRWQCVDDGVSANDDSDYVSSSTAGHKGTFGLTDLPVSGTVSGVRVYGRMRKDEGGTREARLILKSGGAIQNEATQAQSLSYVNQQGAIRETDPNTGAAWTVSAVNALEAGVEIVT